MMNWMQRRKRRARRRRIAGALLGVLIGLGVLLLAGAVLPIERITRGELRLDRSPESVWRVLIDLDGMPRWRSDLTALERLPDLGGRPAWKETGPGGTRIIQLASAEPPHRMVTRQTIDGRPGFPVRTVELAASASGTIVRVTEQERVGDPFRRVLAWLGIRRGGPPRFLRDLALLLTGGRRQVAVAPK